MAPIYIETRYISRAISSHMVPIYIETSCISRVISSHMAPYVSLCPLVFSFPNNFTCPLNFFICSSCLNSYPGFVAHFIFGFLYGILIFFCNNHSSCIDEIVYFSDIIHWDISKHLFTFLFLTFFPVLISLWWRYFLISMHNFLCRQHSTFFLVLKLLLQWFCYILISYGSQDSVSQFL